VLDGGDFDLQGAEGKSHLHKTSFSFLENGELPAQQGDAKAFKLDSLNCRFIVRMLLMPKKV
jgi:hypothetical protein